MIFQKILQCNRVYNQENMYKDLYAGKLTEIALVETGSGTCSVLGQAIPCNEGDIYVFNAEVPHGFFLTEAGETLTVRRLWFDVKNCLHGDAGNSGNDKFCFGVFNENETLAYTRLNAQTLREVQTIFERITQEMEGKRCEWQEVVRANVAMLLITFTRYTAGTIKNIPSGSSKDWGLVNTAIRIIGDEFHDCDLTLERVAKHLYVSLAHASRLFKKLVGKTFSDYVREVRLRHACRLLKETSLSVEEIVGKCGLCDVPTFYRIFKKQFNTTPKQYRIQYGANRNKKEKKLVQILNDISENLQRGKAKIVKELVQTALDEGIAAKEILGCLLDGMNIIGEKFKNNEVYVPEVLVAARAMNMGTQILKPYLADSGVTALGRACIGTVQGDLHDIGKNLVKMMLEGKGLEVIDLGVDVPPQTFVQAAIDNHCQIICCSALLTTTMGVMADVVKEAEAAGIRDKVKIMIGGAPITDEFCKQIGADVYTPDAATAADKAVEFCKEM